MKLCISTLGCPTWSLQQIIDGCAQAGIEGVDFRGLGNEIDVTKLPEFNERLPETLSALRARGLSMPCLNSSITLVTPAPERWKQMLDECQRTAQLAARTGTTMMRIFGGKVPNDLGHEEARLLAHRHLRQLIKICAANGCQVVVETHDDWSTSNEVLALVSEFTPDEVGVLWDIEHPYRKGESPDATAERLGKWIRHVHVKDSVRQGTRNAPRLLGEGDVPITACVRLLKQQGYDGWLCLESEKRWHTDAADPEVAFPQFASFMREAGA